MMTQRTTLRMLEFIRTPKPILKTPALRVTTHPLGTFFPGCEAPGLSLLQNQTLLQTPLPTRSAIPLRPPARHASARKGLARAEIVRGVYSLGISQPDGSGHLLSN